MEGYLSVEGVNLWFRKTGEFGAPVLHIHGSGLASFAFAPVTERLSDEFTCIDFDMRGYGRSDRPDNGYSLERWAADAVGVLDGLGIAKAHIHGISMGAMVATVMAAHYPERVGALVLLGASAKSDFYGVLQFRSWIEVARRSGLDSVALAELFMRDTAAPHHLDSDFGRERLARLPAVIGGVNSPKPFEAGMNAMIEMDLRPLVPRIEAPTLVACGRWDRCTPWDATSSGAGGRWVQQNIAGAEALIFPNSGHAPSSDSPDEYANAVRDFLARHPID